MFFIRHTFAHAKSIYEIDIDFFKSNKVKLLLVDKDNTLDSFKAYHPSEHAVELVKKLRASDIDVAIISNNHGPKIVGYAEELGIDCVKNSCKPFAKKLNAYISKRNIPKDNIMFVGDQMVTDVGAANKAGIRVVLTDKIVKEDQWTTHINRIFGRAIRKKHQRKGLLIDWRNKYGKD